MENKNQTSRSKLFNVIYPVIVAVIVGVVSVFVSTMSPTNYSSHAYKDNMKYKYEGARNELIECIDQYIAAIAPKSYVNGSAIFEASEKYGIDIKFMLAQAQVESHFCTTGIAAKTNSMYNVKAYDGRSAAHMLKHGAGFDHPDKSVMPYAKLLAENYLVDGKTEADMFDKFVDKYGHRYASNKNYEKQLFDVYSKIDDVVDISTAVFNYNKYKTLALR